MKKLILLFLLIPFIVSAQNVTVNKLNGYTRTVSGSTPLDTIAMVQSLATFSNGQTMIWNSTLKRFQSSTPFTFPSLTSGSVLFSDGTTLAQDNANFFWDNSNKRLGIGTSSPTSKIGIINNSLGVTGDPTVTGISLLNTTSSTSILNQYSPSLVFGGNTWDPSPGSNLDGKFAIGTSFSASMPAFTFRYSGNGASYGSSLLTILSNGNINAINNITTTAQVNGLTLNASTGLTAGSASRIGAYGGSMPSKIMFSVNSTTSGFLLPRFTTSQVSTMNAGVDRAVQAIKVTNMGSGYTTATISFTGGGSPTVNAAATATLSGGQIISIQVTNAGQGYTSIPSVVITGNGTGATATAYATPLGLQVYDTDKDRISVYTPGLSRDIAYTSDITSGTVTSVTSANSDISVANPTTTPVLTLASGTGTGSIVRASSPTLVTPNLGTPSALVGTNITGSASSFNSGTATTLQTARNINGVSFNGSADITLPSNTLNQVLTAGNLGPSGVSISILDNGFFTKAASEDKGLATRLQLSDAPSATRAADIQLASDGDMLFSTQRTGTWSERLRISNSTGVADYSADVSASYTPRSLVDKAYVDAVSGSSGTWTPTATGVTNISGSSANSGTWMRVGNVVSADVTISVTTGGVGASIIDLSLPVASDFTSSEDLNGQGTGAYSPIIANQVYAFGNTLSDNARIQFNSVLLGSTELYIHFSYVVQ